VFGTSALGSKVFEELTKRPDLFPTVIPVAEELASAQGLNGSGERLKRAIETCRPDRVILALAERRNRLPVEYLVQVRLRGIRVEDAVDVYERLTQKLALEFLTPSAFLYTKQLPKSALYLHLHRSLSVVLAVLGLIAGAPLMALIALAVKLDSPGPVFFRQQRVGWRDRVFLLYKFRTMRNAEPAAPHSTWHRDDAPRVTRVGRWLRRSRLDELPQFWNILRGDMNFIGPRPEMVQNVEQMAQEIPFYRLRHIIRPGITGWAQVRNGYAVDRETVWEKIRYDLYYLKNMGFALDLTILFESVKVILFGEHGDTNV
jgi:exopolysaccharide biosynthesis polyprenyl glycosylphosphotransferase